MSPSIHSVQYVRKKYKTYQLITFLFAVITIVAALAAAVSGHRITQLNALQKKSLEDQRAEAVNADQLKAEIKALKKESSGYQKQVASEKNRIKALSAKIEALEKELNKTSRTEATETAPAVVESTKPVLPEEPVAAEPQKPQPGQIVEPSAPMEAQTPPENMTPQTEALPSAQPMTIIENPPAVESHGNVEDKTPPSAPAAQVP